MTQWEREKEIENVPHFNTHSTQTGARESPARPFFLVSCMQTFGFEAILLLLLVVRTSTLSVGVTNGLLWSRVAVTLPARGRGRSGRSFCTWLSLMPLAAPGTVVVDGVRLAINFRGRPVSNLP